MRLENPRNFKIRSAEALAIKPNSDRRKIKFPEQIRKFQDAIGDKTVELIKRIPQMQKRAGEIEENPHQDIIAKKIKSSKTKEFFRKIGLNVKSSWEKTFGKRMKNRQEKKLESLLKNPEKHKKEIKKELEYAFYHSAGRRKVVEKILGFKKIMQFPGLIFDHLPLPIPKKIFPLLPFVVPFLPEAMRAAANLTTWQFLREYASNFSIGTPILLGSIVIAGIFNIPNAIQAFMEKRYKKAVYELFVLTPISAVLPIGIIDNSFWQEAAFFRPQELRRNKRFILHLDSMLSNKNNGEDPKRKIYEEIFQNLVSKKYGEKNDSLQISTQKALPKLEEREKEAKEDIERNHKGIVNQKVILNFLNYVENFGGKKLPNAVKIATWLPMNLLTILPKVFVHAGLALSENDEKLNRYKIETLEIIKKLIDGQNKQKEVSLRAA